MVRTYRSGEINGCQGKTCRLVDVPQEWAFLNSLLDNITVFRAHWVAESSLEKGIHVNNSSNLACECESNISQEMVYARTVRDAAASRPMVAGP